MTGTKIVTPEYWRLREELKRLLNQPLAGGRGAQYAQDKAIHHAAKQLSEYSLPERG